MTFQQLRELGRRPAPPWLVVLTTWLCGVAAGMALAMALGVHP